MPPSTVGKRKPLHRDHAAFFAALGRRIKELRKERNWSLNHMNVVHGYVASQWQGFEKGKALTIDSLLKMAEIFEVTLVKLLDSLGEFPTRALEEVAKDPANPTDEELTLKKAGTKRSSAPKKKAK